MLSKKYIALKLSNTLPLGLTIKMITFLRNSNQSKGVQKVGSLKAFAFKGSPLTYADSAHF